MHYGDEETILKQWILVFLFGIIMFGDIAWQSQSISQLIVSLFYYVIVAIGCYHSLKVLIVVGIGVLSVIT